MPLDVQTRASALAAQNFERNLAALRTRQPRLPAWIEDQALDLEWLFGRDGTLTARDANGGWLNECSVPRLRSGLVLKTLEIRGSVACFLAPGHAADLAFAFERMTSSQALVTLVPRLTDLAAMLHSHDFSAEILAGRLFFVAGAAWDVEFERLLEEQVGLATPNSFIRLPHADEAVIQHILESAQAIIVQANERRAAQVTRLRESYVPPGRRRVCIVAPMQFRLWNDFGAVIEMIQAAVGDLNISVIDTDSPANAAPHALLAAASQSDMLLTMNTSRTDLPGIVPADLPWVTWVTGARIPSAALAGDSDRLLLSHASLQSAALRAGWPADQIQIARWPSSRQNPGLGRNLSLVCNTRCLDTPDDLRGYSSHLILWETIRAELLSNPFVIRQVDDYLQTHLNRLNITDSAFSHSRFVEQLIVPAQAQGLARTLQNAGIAFDIWGSGWERMSDAAGNLRGEVKSRTELRAVLERSIGLIHPFVPRVGHPILSLGMPVVAATDPTGFIRLARQALNGRIIQAADASPSLDAGLLSKLLDTTAVFL